MFKLSGEREGAQGEEMGIRGNNGIAVLMDYNTAINTLPYVKNKKIQLILDACKRAEASGDTGELSKLESVIGELNEGLYKFEDTDENIRRIADYLVKNVGANTHYANMAVVGNTMAFSIYANMPKMVEDESPDKPKPAYLVINPKTKINKTTHKKNPVILRIDGQAGTYEQFEHTMRQYGYTPEQSGILYAHIAGTT